MQPGAANSDEIGMRKALLPVAALVFPLAIGCTLPAALTPVVPRAGWHLAWRAETAFAGHTTMAQTCRFTARLTGSGSRLQAEFTSPFTPGTGYTIAAAGIAAGAGPTSLQPVPGTGRDLTFGGQTSVTVPAGGLVRSDPLPWQVQPGTTVEVTVTASAGDAATKGFAVEQDACADGVLEAPTEAPAADFTQPTPVRWLRSLLVDGPAQRSIVAFGDSITEGPRGLLYQRWSDVLAATGVTVANAGVGGGEISQTGMYGSMPGLTRAKALIAEPGITDVVMLLGINDLDVNRSAAQVLTAMRTVLTEAKTAGIRVWVRTITPRGGSVWDRKREAVRQQVNANLRGSWLTTQGSPVIDTDKAIRNPLNPSALRPSYDSGDHLHPNPAGSRILGLTIGHALGLPVR